MAVGVENIYCGLADWKKASTDAGAPYTVWRSAVMPWYCVMDKNGKNALEKRPDGAVFTNKEVATKLCDEWNGVAD